MKCQKKITIVRNKINTTNKIRQTATPLGMEPFSSTLEVMDSLCDQLGHKITATSANLEKFNEKLTQHVTNIKDKETTMHTLHNSMKELEGIMENEEAEFEKEMEVLIGMCCASFMLYTLNI